MKVMKRIKKHYNYILWGILSVHPNVVFAQGTITGGGTGGGTVAIQNPVAYPTFSAFMAAILDIVVKIGAPIALIMVIYAGFLFVTAQGNEEKLTIAKRALLWALIGTMILLGAKIISTAVCNTIVQITPGGSVTNCP